MALAGAGLQPDHSVDAAWESCDLRVSRAKEPAKRGAEKAAGPRASTSNGKPRDTHVIALNETSEIDAGGERTDVKGADMRSWRKAPNFAREESATIHVDDIEPHRAFSE